MSGSSSVIGIVCFEWSRTPGYPVSRTRDPEGPLATPAPAYRADLRSEHDHRDLDDSGVAVRTALIEV